MSASEDQQRKARFWKKFLRLTRGRIVVLRALGIIAEEETDPAFSEVILQLKADVENGSALSESMKKHQSVFSRSVRELIRSAEMTGAWDDVLDEIVEGLSEGTFE